jgi:hypothetical protein
MPHRNRVDPWSGLIETPARGAWYGNRGCLHDREGRIRDRVPPTDAWIICLLAFKGRKRKLLQPGRFTELFFLDEATGLAAGHRPCGECRRAELRRFGAVWPHKAKSDPFARVPEIDSVLRRERRDPADPRRRAMLDPRRPPADGLMYVIDEGGEERALLASGGRLWLWSPAGYAGPLPWHAPLRARMLTPPSTAGAIENGYAPQIHPSATR